MLRLLQPLLLAGLAAGCSFAHGPRLAKIAPEINATLRTGEDTIQPGDLIQVKVIADQVPGIAGITDDKSFQLNQDVRVQADGRASFIGLDDLPASGLLPAQLDEILTERYTTLLSKEPVLSVAVAEQAPRTVTVFGEVQLPGLVIVPPDQHLTLIDALGRAGGPTTDTAWLSNTLLMRWDADAGVHRTWKIDARRRHWVDEETVFLQARDIVFVPNTNIDHANILVDKFIRRMIPVPNIFAPVN
ncbi:MAG: polysaccharide biosynthesis/export family protein [Planctomycetota bacterium]